MSDQTRQALLEDLRSMINKYEVVSRDFYRKNGAFSESLWSKYFPTFGDFVAAAVGVVDQKNAEKNTFTADTWNIELPKTRIHTLPELLEYCKVDLGLWEVERFIVNKWEVAAKDANGILQVEPLYQVKASLVKRKEIVDARKELERLKAEFKKEAPVRKRLSAVPQLENDNILEINIPDSHFGKMAWGAETGGRPYDVPIAAATFIRSLRTLIYLANCFSYSKIIFVVGNDLLNSDDELGRTTKGTYVSTDGRYKKTFVTVRKTIVEAIEILREIAPVEVIMVSGNHDALGVWHLGDSLECTYANTEDVTIRNEPATRKYVRHGNVLLMLTHGDKGKREDYPLLMATERPKDFGETKFREIHTGHIHQTKLQEWHGVRVRILPSLSPPDVWHSENGFTGQQRNAEAYVWNAKFGLVAMYFHNDDAFSEITTDRIINKG
jgi:hypothetical protein